MKQYRWKAYMIYYIVEIILVVITLFLMVYGLIHPRPHIWTIILMMILFVISMYRETKRVRAGKIIEIIRYFFGIPIGLYMSYGIGYFGTVFFPDEIPESARDVEWVMPHSFIYPVDVLSYMMV